MRGGKEQVLIIVVGEVVVIDNGRENGRGDRILWVDGKRGEEMGVVEVGIKGK